MIRTKYTRTGFTLIELLVVIAIIGILSSVVLASLNSARAKARYAKTMLDFKQIEVAAELDQNSRGAYAPDAMWCDPPAFVPASISSWPKSVCPGWGYDWENWDGGGTIRITLRGPNCATSYSGGAVYYYCISTTGTCHSGDGVDIKTVANKEINC